MNYVGIDPGLSGAVALIRGHNIRLYDTPILTVVSGKKTRREYDVLAMGELIHKLCDGRNVTVGLEKQHAMPKQGLSSTFTTGMGYGIWRGIIASQQLPVEVITSQAWKKSLMQGMGKEKDASRLKARELFPKAGEQMKLKKHHGRADALLIAEYVRRLRHAPV